MDNVDTAQQGGVVPVRPDPAVNVDAIPTMLRELAQWVCWTYATRDGKKTKVPIRARDGSFASTTDPSTWATFEDAVSAWKANGYAGIGFVFTTEDPFCGIDLDDCIDDAGVILPAATNIVESFGSYCEVSPSGRGLKIFIVGRKPEWAASRSKGIRGFKETEIYDHGRFFTVTGRRVAEAPGEVRDGQAALEALCLRLWPQNQRSKQTRSAASGGFAGDDNSLTAKACAAKNGEAFRKLWAGDTSGHGGDDSVADLALCCHLAFWTGCDVARMDRLFQQSGLMRDKWDEPRGERTYGESTMAKAIEGSNETFSGSRRAAGANSAIDTSSGAKPTDADEIRALLGTRDRSTGRLILSPKHTLTTAEAYLAEFNQHPEGRTLHRYGGALFEWRGNRYVEIEQEWVEQRVQQWLDRAVRMSLDKRNGQIERVDFESNPRTLRDAVESIASLVHLPAQTVSPSWLDGGQGRPPALELLPCKSLNVHLPTGRVVPATPALFTLNAIEFDYDADAPLPIRWFQLLKEPFGDDAESVNLLQEWMGYCLSGDTSQQKMLLLVGPRRSGKGTVGRVLTQLVGAGNVVGPTTGSLAGTFGLQTLIGKSLAIVSDARFGGGHAGAVVERLLCISGEDTLSIDRKYLGSVSMRLPTRFMFLTNELPSLQDASNALTGRFLVLRLRNSFFGHEDTTLGDQLVAELPGILLWAIEGWKRLRAHGKFRQPASSADAIQAMEDLGSPIGAFVRARCDVAPGRRVAVDDLYHGWRGWCEENGHDAAGSKQSFGRDLKALLPQVEHRRGTGNATFYEGVGLRPHGFTE